MRKIKAGIYGASGYAGWELYQILSHHPQVEILFATSEAHAGETLADIWPQGSDLRLQSAGAVDPGAVDCVFLCLPHTLSAPIAAEAHSAGAAVIDLSADLRLHDPAKYELWYQAEHSALHLLPVVYGLPEHNREAIRGQKMIANPGCYATAILLGLLPLAKKNLLVEDAPIIVDAKSGTTGAGRKARQHLLFSEVHGNFTPYKIGRAHQHIGEIEQQLAAAGVSPGKLIFAPHLLPVDRGILAAMYVQVVDMSGAIQAVRAAYQAEPLVTVLPPGELASLAHAVRTPCAYISLTMADDILIINAAIDNLLKGAASQAVQNFNLMFGCAETTALLPGC